MKSAKRVILLLAILATTFSAKAQVADSLTLQRTLDSLSVITSFSGYHYYSPRLDTNNMYYYAYTDTNDVVHRLTKSIFEEAENYSENLAMVKFDGKYGYIDTAGKVAIACVYDNASAFNNHVAIVFADCKTGIVDKQGNLTLLTKDYEYVYPFVENRAVVIEKGNYGVINKSGEEVVTPRYKNIVSYSMGLAIVTDSTTKKDGAIDTLGVIVYPTNYNSMQSFNSFGYSEITNFYLNKKGKPVQKMGLCNTKGNVIVPVEYDNLAVEYPMDWFRMSREEDFLIVAYNLKYKKNDEERYYKSKFVRWLKYRLFKRKYKKKGSIRRALHRLKDNTLFDNAGKKLHYESKNIIGVLDSKHAYTVNSKELRLINIKGDKKVLNKLNFDFSSKKPSFRNEVILVVNKKKKRGLIDFDGNLEIDVAYDRIQEVTDDNYFYGDKVYMGYKNDTITVFNSLYKPIRKIIGDKIIQQELYAGYVNKYNMPEKKSVFVVIKNKKCGLLDKDYNPVLPFEYDTLGIYFNRIIFAQNGKYGIMDENLKVIKQPGEYKIISNDGVYLSGKTNFVIRDKKKTGLSDLNGNIILQPIYSRVWNIVRYITDPVTDTVISAKNYFNVKIGKKEGLLDANQKEIIPIKQDLIQLFDNRLSVRYKKKEALFTFEGVNLTGFIYSNVDDGSTYNYGGPTEYYVVFKDEKGGLIDSMGTVVVPIIYDGVTKSESAEYYYVTTNKLMGVVNTKNQMIVPQLYNWVVYNSSANSFYVEQNGKTGITDINGKVIIPLEYDDINEWQNDLYMLRNGPDYTGKYGVANKMGKIIIPADYERDQISFYRKTIILETDGKKFFYNSQGDPVSDCYLDKHIGEDYDDWGDY